MKIRNIAIIAHVDHGKTTIVDGLLKQSKTFRDNESAMSQDLIMDSNDQERERGITILAKNTAVNYKDIKINIIDTPGHADFGGEVERTLNMANGALLIVDAQEGPMPQTKFVLKKALSLNLKIIVIINKIDKPNSRVDFTLSKIYDLFLELATDESQLEFPVLYASGKLGKAWKEMPSDFNETADFSPIFETVLETIPEPKANENEPFQMLVSALDWDAYKGKFSIGRVNNGKIHPGDKVVLVKTNGTQVNAVVEKVYENMGLKKVEVTEGCAGDIVILTGIKETDIGDTICSPEKLEALPFFKIADPTLSISIGANTSPFKGHEGKFLTGRQIEDRINRELQTNVAMRMTKSDDGKFILSGRGELHLSVFFETLRREGYEFEISKPVVITKFIDNIEMEPLEELCIDVDNEYVGAIKGEVGRRKGILISQEDLTEHSSRIFFEITTRGILGLRNTLLTLSKGTAVISSTYIRDITLSSDIQKLRKGVIVAAAEGKAVAYGILTAQNKGPVFIEPQDMVYEGMIVGLNGRDEDIEVNVCKEKNLSNVRSKGEEPILLSPSVKMSLEQYLSMLEDDELLEITPTKLRLRKKILNTGERKRSWRYNN